MRSGAFGDFDASEKKLRTEDSPPNAGKVGVGEESPAVDAAWSPGDLSRMSDDRVPTEDVLRASLLTALERVSEPLVLAISGGRDSMALMFAVARWAPHRLAAVATFDHGTGTYATEAASLVATEARRLGLTVVRERSREVASGEAAWRDARWQFLRRVARAYGARVATAHTQDDQLETIVMRLLRGAGTRGLAALAAPSTIVRPWLPVTRAEVASWAMGESVPYLEDPTNASRRFQRGRVRHDLLPALTLAQSDFAASMLALGEQAAEWRREVDHFLDHHIAMLKASTQLLDLVDRGSERRGTICMPASVIDDTNEEGRAVMWAAAFGRLGVALDARGTRELVRFSNSPRRGAHVRVAGGAVAMRSRAGSFDIYELRRAMPLANAREYEWTGRAETVPTRLGGWRWRRIPARSPSAVTSADSQPESTESWIVGVPLGERVTIRTWRPGDRIQTVGAPAGRRVTRYFSDKHVAALDRSGWPVVLLNDVLLCVPGICRAQAAPRWPGRPDSIWYRCEREHD